MRKTFSWLLALAMMVGLLAVALPAQADYVKLTWAQGTGADAPNDVAEVNEALNVISREKLGVEVDILYFTGEQIRTSVLAGEVYDMYFTCDWYNDYVTQSFNGIFADITDKVKEWTPDLYATMPEEVWELSKVDGKLFAIPVKKDYCPEIFVIFDRALFAELGMEIPMEMNLLDLTPYLEAYKEVYPDGYPLMLSKGSSVDGIFNYINRDTLIGFPYSAAGTENATKIISVFEDEEMIVRFNKMREWFEAGYINPDASTTESGSIDNKVNFIKFGQGFYGADTIWSASYQYPVQITKISGPYLSASGVRGSMNALSVTLEDDLERFELALKYQELVNTDLIYRDILRYGVEGKHFVYNDDGTVTKTDDGVNNYAPWPFSQGSYALSRPEYAEGVYTDPNMWAVIFSSYANAKATKTIGFSFDPINVEAEIGSLQAIKTKYWEGLATGTLNPEDTVATYVAEAEAAGIRRVVEECQRQLDEFISGN